jgi:uncharacterized MAPEG superfamily protein
MSVELRMLVYSAILLLVLILIQAGAGLIAVGVAPMAGNRDDLPPPTPFQARSKRVVANHIENLVVFAPLLLAAVLAHRTGSWTALGAELFFWGRLVHGAVYLAGIPWIRTLAHAVTLTGAGLVILTDLGVL